MAHLRGMHLFAFAQIREYDIADHFMWDREFPFSQGELNFEQFSLRLLFKCHSPPNSGRKTYLDDDIPVLCCSNQRCFSEKTCLSGSMRLPSLPHHT